MTPYHVTVLNTVQQMSFSKASGSTSEAFPASHQKISEMGSDAHHTRGSLSNASMSHKVNHQSEFKTTGF